MIFENIRSSFKSLFRQRTRSILALLAVSIGIGSVVMVMAAGKGIERLIMGQLDAFQSDTLYVQTKVPSTQSSGGGMGITITSLKQKDINAISKLENVSAVYGTLTGQEPISYNGQIKKIILMGNGAAMPEMEHIELTVGRFFSQDEEDSLAQVAILGSKAQEKLFADDNPVGKTIYVQGKPYKVLGALKERGSSLFLDMDNVIILPVKTMQKKLLGIDYFAATPVKLKDASRDQETAEAVKKLLRENHNITDPKRDDFEVQTMTDAKKLVGQVAGGITILLTAIVSISLVVGGVGIMNIMYVSVAERTFEIGLRKALGARGKDIMWQFIIEAGVITSMGGVIGITLGIILAAIVYFLATHFGLKWVFAIPPSSIVLSISFSVIIGLVFGIYPARKAAKLNPIEALRRE